MKNEIYIPVKEVTELAVGDDNVLSRQYLIDNTINTLLKVFDTHDFYMQINDSEPSADAFENYNVGKSKTISTINRYLKVEDNGEK